MARASAAERRARCIRRSCWSGAAQATTTTVSHRDFTIGFIKKRDVGQKELAGQATLVRFSSPLKANARVEDLLERALLFRLGKDYGAKGGAIQLPRRRKNPGAELCAQQRPHLRILIRQRMRRPIGIEKRAPVCARSSWLKVDFPVAIPPVIPMTRTLAMNSRPLLAAGGWTRQEELGEQLHLFRLGNAREGVHEALGELLPKCLVCVSPYLAPGDCGRPRSLLPLAVLAFCDLAPCFVSASFGSLPFALFKSADAAWISSRDFPMQANRFSSIRWPSSKTAGQARPTRVP